MIAEVALLVALAAPTAIADQEATQPPPVSSQGAPPKKEKKAKKDKPDKKVKKPKSDKPAPDEDDDPDAEPEGGEPGTRFIWKQHPSVRFGSVARVDFEAKLQEDVHGSYSQAPGLDCPDQALPTTCFWQLHRNRLGFKGNFFRKVDFEMERELTEQELSDKDVLLGYTPKSQWKDVYLNLRFIKKAQIQVGKFKIPFGLDELTGVSHNDFIYRSLGANYLAPARDTGVMVHAHMLHRGLTYAVGVFQHDGDNARSKKVEGGDLTFATRITGLLFRRTNLPVLETVEVGSAFTVSALSDDPYLPNGLRGRTVLTQDTFYAPVYVKGHRRRWEADADWTGGPASVRGEYTWVSDGRLKQGLGDEDLPDARAQSWYVSGTYILTGERKKRPLRADGELLQGGIGAVEIAARYERMWFDSSGDSQDDPSRTPRAANILTSGDKALTLGVNWALNRFLKIQFNAVREHVEDPQRNPIASGGAFWSRMVRFQIVL